MDAAITRSSALGSRRDFAGVVFHKTHQGAVANEARLHALHQPCAQLAV